VQVAVSVFERVLENAPGLVTAGRREEVSGCSRGGFEGTMAFRRSASLHTNRAGYCTHFMLLFTGPTTSRITRITPTFLPSEDGHRYCVLWTACSQDIGPGVRNKLELYMLTYWSCAWSCLALFTGGLPLVAFLKAICNMYLCAVWNQHGRTWVVAIQSILLIIRSPSTVLIECIACY
jgi:hypothetical protein